MDNIQEDDANPHRREMGRLAIVDRVRGGQLQIRKVVNEVTGYKIQDGQLVKMTPDEIRSRKRGGKIGERKRKAEAAKIDRNLHLSLAKRETRLS